MKKSIIFATKIDPELNATPKNNKLKIYRIILSLLLLLPLTANAQGGESAFNFLRLPYSSRAAALGGSNISVIDDDLSLTMHNPALLVNASDKTIDLSFMTYMSGSKVAGAAFNKHFGERSSGAISARYIDYGKFDGYTDDNIYTGTFRAMDFELGITYSYLLSNNWSGGVTGKLIYSQYESLNSLALGVDLGLNYYNPDIDFSASLTFKNLGGQVMTFEQKYELMPIDIQLGFTKRLSHAPILISATLVNLHKWSAKDFYNADGSVDNFGEILLKHIVLGADVLIGKNFYASIGYNYRLGREMSVSGRSFDGFSLGAGLHISKVKFGVSYSKLHISASSLLFNLSYSL